MYMDNSATSPVKEEVFNAMIPYLKEEFGNPSTFYKLGRNAKKAVETARENVAKLINAETKEIIFTSGGTESDNMAIKGIAFKLEDKGKHIITTEIEHPAVLRTCEYLESKGFEVTYLPVKENGIINVEDLKEAIREDTILISVMHANNEIGTIQPIAEVGAIAKENGITFHVDAVQSVGKIPVDVKEANIDLLSISSHKLYGPKGVGAIFIRKGVRLETLIHGGGQENGLRSGTENVPGIVGFGKAAELAYEHLDENIAKLKEIRDLLIEEVLEKVPESYLNGDREQRLPNNASFRFAAIEGEGLILRLDAKGINGATGSACSSKSLKASYVLSALGLADAEIHGSLRLSLGTENSIEDVEVVSDAIAEVVASLRQMSPLWDNEKNESLELDESKFTDVDH
ncbi:MAG: cysteine desulfurase NifS [Methanobrevibacter sp.]|nr:cysteine desulfurase NifS [Methanobrevibacter sp.]